MVVLTTVILMACHDESVNPVAYDPTPYQLSFEGFPPPPLPGDLVLTEAGVALGDMLFHETALSGDLTQSCASCHQQEFGFSDPNTFSIGIDGLPGRRQAMTLANLAWHRNGFFWDGRSPTLRDQALRPIQDPLEMHETLDNAIAKLRDKPAYADAFVRAFGDDDISAERIGLALEQFMITLISNDSRFDQYRRGELELTESELRGYVLFHNEFDPLGAVKGAECFHCHGGFNFTNDRFSNNGLDAPPFADDGRFEVTADPADRGKFLVPTLRNIAETAPYMHDGRFTTLRQVIDHYDHGVLESPTVDPLLQFSIDPGLQLSEQDKQDLEAFLRTLSDPAFMGQ
jgi:cytochrome c peroxidase